MFMNKNGLSKFEMEVPNRKTCLPFNVDEYLGSRLEKKENLDYVEFVPCDPF